MTTTGSFTEYPASGCPYDITAGPDGNLWFLELNSAAPKVGKITPAGVITEYPIPTSSSCPVDITAGPDGNLWFNEQCAKQIGKITPAGVITEYGPTHGDDGICAGPDGNIWYGAGNLMGKITTAGVITEYGTIVGAEDCSPGPDGNVWFSDSGASKIGRITPAGIITEYSIPGGSSDGITNGPDGNLWFAEFSGKIGRITPTGVITEYTDPTNTYGLDITVGPDGSLWFVGSANTIVRFTPPVCGNGILEAGEQCDDGNTISGDGCSATCMAAAPNRLQTGQTQCDQGGGTLGACPGSPAGQDGALQEGTARSYTDNGDGTVTDNTTGLMWEKKSSDGSLHDQGTTYTWANAFSVFIAGLNTASFAGHNDWRLPNINELQSIANYQNTPLAVDTSFNTNCAASCTATSCSCTQSNSYWSSTTYQHFPSLSFVVSFGDGQLGASNNNGALLYVRAVRGGASQRLQTGQTTCYNSGGAGIACAGTGQDGALREGTVRSYTDNGDGTVTDNATGLTWEKKSSDGSLHDQGTTYTWASAFSVFITGLNTANFAGHNDWRLPNANELLTIANYGTTFPAVDSVFNTSCAASCTVTNCSCTQSDYYWASTSSEDDPTTAWPVDFNGGFLIAASKGNGSCVRAVRSAPVCGNGIVEAGEQCDDGAANGTSSSCCTATCTFATAGTVCRPSAGGCDVPESCTGSSGTCPADANPTCTPTNTAPVTTATNTATATPVPPNTPTQTATRTPIPTSTATATPAATAVDTSTFTPSANPTGTATPGSGCPTVARSGCRTAGKSVLVIKGNVGGKVTPSDSLVWKWLKGASTSQQEFGNPLLSANYTVCLYAGSNLNLIAGGQMLVPASGTKWSMLSVTGWKYQDPTSSPAGVEKMLLKGSGQNTAKVVVKGKGPNLPHPALPVATVDFPVAVQLANTDTAPLCWESIFQNSDVVTYNPGVFIAKSH